MLNLLYASHLRFKASTELPATDARVQAADEASIKALTDLQTYNNDPPAVLNTILSLCRWYLTKEVYRPSHVEFILAQTLGKIQVTNPKFAQVLNGMAHASRLGQNFADAIRHYALLLRVQFALQLNADDTIHAVSDTIYEQRGLKPHLLPSPAVVLYAPSLINVNQSGTLNSLAAFPILPEALQVASDARKQE